METNNEKNNFHFNFFRNIYIPGMFNKNIEIDLTNSEDVFEEGQPDN